MSLWNKRHSDFCHSLSFPTVLSRGEAKDLKDDNRKIKDWSGHSPVHICDMSSQGCLYLSNFVCLSMLVSQACLSIYLCTPPSVNKCCVSCVSMSLHVSARFYFCMHFKFAWISLCVSKYNSECDHLRVYAAVCLATVSLCVCYSVRLCLCLHLSVCICVLCKPTCSYIFYLCISMFL